MNSTSNIVPASREAITRAAGMIREGGLVAFPTETVYGLGADATNDTAVAGIFEAKNRPDFNPLIVHSHNIEAACELGVFDSHAKKLARKFWPGPLTLVVPRPENSKVSLLASAGLDSIAIRVPDNDIALDLLSEIDGPLAAPSANISGSISPTTAQHVFESLGNRVPLILDGGPCKVGIESTIVQSDDGVLWILRPGYIPQFEIEEFLGESLLSPATHTERPNSPGQLERHYAPAQRVRLNVTAPGENESFLAFGSGPRQNSNKCLNLSPTGDLKEAAANLFAMMRQLDKLDCEGIAVMEIPQTGLGVAINDRLRRAAFQPDEASA